VKIPPMLTSEAQRLASLKSLDLLDTPAEERFDRLTRMARRLFHVPVALFSLVDERRQWHKSRIGVEHSEFPLDLSFCVHTIRSDDLLVVADTWEDSRFRDHLLVQGQPRFRFYAGCAVTAPDGERIGSLCILDQVPRHFQAEELETLRDLAAMVAREVAAGSQSMQDDLSQLVNRRGFPLLAEHGLNICVRYGLPVSLVTLELENVERIIRARGQEEGNRALSVFAGLLKKSFRDSDLFARLGSQQFAVMLTNTPSNLASRAIARFSEKLSQYNAAAIAADALSFSWSVVQFDPEKHHTVQALLADAEAASLGQRCGAA